VDLKGRVDNDSTGEGILPSEREEIPEGDGWEERL